MKQKKKRKEKRSVKCEVPGSREGICVCFQFDEQTLANEMAHTSNMKHIQHFWFEKVQSDHCLSLTHI